MAALLEYPTELKLDGIALPAVVRPFAPMSDSELLQFSARHQPFRVERTAEGELEIMTPVGGRGSWLEGIVIGQLSTWARSNGGFVFSSAAGFSLRDGSVLSPDASWVSADIWEALTPEQQTGFPPICPEFIVEVRSASDSLARLEAKMQQWLANGARLAWLVDPQREMVVVFRPGRDPNTMLKPQRVMAEVGPVGFELDCEQLW